MDNLNYLSSSVYTFPSYARAKTLLPRARKNNQQVLLHKPFTVGMLMQKAANESKYSLLLGADARSQPVFLQMNSCKMGGVLVTCGAGCGKTHQLQVMAESLLRSQNLNQAKIIAVSTNTQEWASFNLSITEKNNQKNILSWYEPAAQEMIGDLTSLAEQRRGGQHAGPAIYLMLDDLSALDQLDWENQINLRWLLEYGPQSHIWPIATLDSTKVSKIPFWVEPFSSFIWGSGFDALSNLPIDCQAVAKQITGLEPGEFMTQLQGEWRSYRLPMLGD